MRGYHAPLAEQGTRAGRHGQAAARFQAPCLRTGLTMDEWAYVRPYRSNAARLAALPR